MNNINFCKSFIFTSFKFAKYRFTDHSYYPGCPRHFIGRMIKGTARITTANYQVDIKEGDIFYMSKGIMYQSRWYGNQNDEIEFQSFGFDVFPKTNDSLYAMQVVHPSKEAVCLLDKISEDMKVSCLNIGRFYAFLGSIELFLKPESQNNSNKIINEAIEFIRSKPDCSVKDIAKKLRMSESGIYSLFKRTLNKTPVDIKHRLLVDKAKELLRTTDLSIEEISNRLGFSSSSYFRKIVKEVTNKTPREIRKEAQF